MHLHNFYTLHTNQNSSLSHNWSMKVKYGTYFVSHSQIHNLDVAVICFYIIIYWQRTVWGSVLGRHFQSPTPKPLGHKGTWMTQSLTLGLSVAPHFLKSRAPWLRPISTNAPGEPPLRQTCVTIATGSVTDRVGIDPRSQIPQFKS